MRIAMIGQKGLPASWGGVEKHVEEMSARLAKNGHEVTVFCRRWYSDYERPIYRGAVLRFLPSIRTKHLDAISHSLLATFAAVFGDFDIIHYHGVGPSLLSWIPRLFKPSAKVAATFHCQDRCHGKWGLAAKTILLLGEWAACRFPHQTIVVSQTLQKYVKNRYNREAVFIPNGVSPLARGDGSARKKFGLEKNKYLLSVSRLVSHKSLHQLIETFRTLKKKEPKLTKGLKLALVGDGSYTDDYVNYLKKISRGIPVVFTGWQTGKNLNDIVDGAVLFVHPSRSEGLPLVVLEAMAGGKPVIASDIPEHQEIIPDKRFLFKCGQIADLEKKIFWALKNPEILKVAGLQNKRLAEKEYDWRDIAELTEGIYQKLLAKNRAGWPIFLVKCLEAK